MVPVILVPAVDPFGGPGGPAGFGGPGHFGPGGPGDFGPGGPGGIGSPGGPGGIGSPVILVLVVQAV